MLPPVRERASVRCDATPEALWPLLSDTDRLNRESGLGEVHVRANPEGGLARHLVTSKFGPLTLEWAELPFEWVEPRRLSVRREVRKGLIERIHFELELEPQGSATEVSVQVSLTPRHRRAQPIAAVAARVVVKKLSDGVRLLAETLRVPAASGPGPVAAQVHAEELARAGARLRGAVPEALRGTAQRLEAWLGTAPDHAVIRVRPYELAEDWGLGRRQALELCLHASVAGLLDLSWDVVCPSCRTASSRLPELSELDDGGHCDLCDLAFGIDMDRAVEASFRPSAAIRNLEDPTFCTGGPGATPHVVAQAIVDPGAPAALAVPSTEGRYRLFVRGGAKTTVEVGGGQPARCAVEIDPAAPPPAELTVAPGGTLELRLTGDEARHAKLEHLAWASRAATAYEVTTVPTFRRFFGREALKPGLSLQVRRAALMFSDLSASTALYAREGDAAAFRLVQDHFDLLEDVIHRHDGAIVKTIGDAVMATFVDETQALAAALAAQRAFPAFRDAHPASEGVFLKIGVYAGPCYAVTANGALDFFGQTVNVAARLQGQADDAQTVATCALVDPLRETGALEGVEVSAPFTPRLKGVFTSIDVVRLVTRP